MTKIIQRHDTAANWTSVNPVLAAGEMGVETDTNKFKFGDGTTAWASLPYAAGEGGSGSGTTITSADGITTYSKLALGDNLVVIPPELPWTNPQMSSNSQDGYVASASTSAQTSLGPYRAFDKDTTGEDLCWYTGGTSMPQWIMLECPKSVRLTSCMIMNEVKTPESFKSGYIQGSNDGSNFDTLYTITDRANTAGLQTTYQIDTETYYKYLRIYCTATSGSGLSIQEIEFSGFIKDKATVPSLNVDTYTKAETDSLLSTKEDKLTAISPIRIYEYTPDYTYVGYTKDENNNLTKDDSSEHYILMPYNKNYLYKFYVGSSNSGGWITKEDWLTISYGYIGDNGEFKRIVYPARFMLLTVLADDGTTIFSVGDNVKNITNVSGTDPKMASNDYYAHSQLYVNGTTLKYNSSPGMISSKQGTNYQTTVSEEVAAQLAKITNIRVQYDANIIPYLNAGGKRSMGYFDIKGWCMDLDKTTRVKIMEENATATYPNKFEFIAKGASVHRIEANPATSSSLGVVQPDGTSITVSDTGIISGQDVKTFTGYSDTGTLVLKSINGVLQWVAE